MSESEAAEAAARPTSLGVVGLGVMGAPIARRLSAQGFGPQVADPDPRTIQLYIMEGGANPAATARHLAQMSTVLVMALTDADALREAVNGINGIVHSVKPGTIVIDMGGGDPETGTALGRALAPRGAAWVEAIPIGTPKQAATGALTILAGGPSGPLDKVAPVLEALAERVVRTGPVGSASLARSLAGLLTVSSLAAAAEALIVAKRFGMEPAAALEAVQAASPLPGSLSPIAASQVLAERPAAGYSLTRAIADIDRVQAAAARSGVPLPLAAALRELCSAARLNLEGSDELSALVRWVERVSRTELSRRGN